MENYSKKIFETIFLCMFDPFVFPVCVLLPPAGGWICDNLLHFPCFKTSPRNKKSTETVRTYKVEKVELMYSLVVTLSDALQNINANVYNILYCRYVVLILHSTPHCILQLHLHLFMLCCISINIDRVKLLLNVKCRVFTCRRVHVPSLFWIRDVRTEWSFV